MTGEILLMVLSFGSCNRRWKWAFRPGTPTTRSSSIWRVMQRRFCMSTRMSPSSFMSRWKLAAQMPWYIGAGTGDAEVPPGVGAGADRELVGHVQRAGVDGDVGDLAATDLDHEGVVGHVEQIGAGEVLAVRLDFGVLVAGLGERVGPLGPRSLAT